MLPENQQQQSGAPTNATPTPQSQFTPTAPKSKSALAKYGPYIAALVIIAAIAAIALH